MTICIPWGLVEVALTSPHGEALASGAATHDEAVPFVAQLVGFTQDEVHITDIVRARLPEGYAGNTLDEVPEMIRSAVRKGFHEKPSGAKRRTKSSRPSASSVALKHVDAAEIELFHDDQREPFISLPTEGGGHRSFRIQSEDIALWVQSVYFGETGKALSKNASAEVIDTLAAQALFGSPRHPVHIRVGEHQREVFVDLGQDNGSVVRITADGWTVTTECPIKFQRSRGFGELPPPVPGGNLAELTTLLGFNNKSWRLFLAFLLNSLNPKGPYMCLLVEGEQGSGKSILCSVAKRIIDPNTVERLRLPKGEHDLMIQAQENWLLTYDNASGIKWDLSDALCALSTGGSFSTRRYYHDNESRNFTHMRPFVINGIGEFASRPDLLERSIQLHLPAMPSDNRKPEGRLWAEFDEMLPRILGCLYDIVAGALRHIDDVEPPTSIRMADAAQWLAAAGQAAGLPDGALVIALEFNQHEIMVERAAQDPLVNMIIGTIDAQKGDYYEALVADLHQHLLNQFERPDRFFPPTPAHLSAALKRLKPAMEKLGLQVDLTKKTRRGRLVRITMNQDLASDAPESEF